MSRHLSIEIPVPIRRPNLIHGSFIETNLIEIPLSEHEFYGSACYDSMTAQVIKTSPQSRTIKPLGLQVY
jgi:hypothetical protein